MAYFRTGGGGEIPAFLKTRMNAVLNKKFGTEKDYNPVYWPDDVNLMGKLEEKTVQAAPIAAFSDGADDVPMASVIAHIAPTLTGKNSVSMVQINSNNLLSFSGVDFTLKGVRFYSVNGVLFLDGSTVGEISSTDDAFKTNLSFYLPAGIYYLNRGTIALPTYIYDVENMTSGNAVRTNNGSFTLAEGKTLALGFYLYQKTFDDDKLDACLNVGSSAITYEDTGAKTTYTANLGRTVYGADADLVSGQGTETYIKYVIDGVNNYAVNISGTNFNIMPYGLSIDGTITKWLCDEISASGTNFGYNSTQGFIFIRQAGWSSLSGVSDVASFNAYCQEHPITLILPLVTGTDFTFDGQEMPSFLGVNNLWHDAGNTEAVYRSSGTVTPVPIQPVLISKTITENGTYSAADDDADGYSDVTVNVPQNTPLIPQFTETKIADNTAHASSFTLSEDYGNYDMVKIVWYESATVSGFLYTTPDILDEIFSVGVGKLCINKPSTNYYICYSKNGLTWTQTNQRVLFVHEIYGVTFTNCTMTATDLYKRGTSTTDKHAVTSQTSLKDYDLFMMASIHATDGSETMPTTWLYQYPPENMGDAFSCPVPTVLQEYNANDEAFVISEYGMTAARYFMVQGIKFTAVSSSRGLMMASRTVTQLVGEESDPDQVNELVEDDENDIREQLNEVVENDENDIREQLNEVVENDETEQEGENDAR